MTYKEYFEGVNSIMNDLYDDHITADDATSKINELNQLAMKSGNLVLLEFLADPQEQTKRVMDAIEFENKQIENNIEDSYGTGNDELDDSSYSGSDWSDWSYSHD